MGKVNHDKIELNNLCSGQTIEFVVGDPRHDRVYDFTVLQAGDEPVGQLTRVIEGVAEDRATAMVALVGTARYVSDARLEMQGEDDDLGLQVTTGILTTNGLVSLRMMGDGEPVDMHFSNPCSSLSIRI